MVAEKKLQWVRRSSLSARNPELPFSPPVFAFSPTAKEVSEITNGEDLELEVTPENSGSMDASEVVVSASAPGVEFHRSESKIAALRAGERYVAQRFELTLPRSFEGNRAVFSVELQQKDFPARIVTKEVRYISGDPFLNQLWW